MDELSSRVKSLAVSQTLAMSQKSAELKASGIDVINLSVGEPDFNTPEHIKQAADKAIAENYTHYSPIAGYLTLRQAICAKLERENGLHYTPEQIVVSTGAKQALCNVILSTIDPGDEVIIPTPAWVSYVEMVKLAEGTSVTLPTGVENDFKISPSQLEAAITERTKMLLLCSPSNPTGSVYSREELAALVEVLSKHPRIIIMADEIYEHINYTGQFTSLGTFAEIADRTVIINGVSKAYAMTGWRIGYCAAPLAIAKACSKLQGQYTSGTNSVAQKAAEAAYNGPQECIEQMREAFRRRRDLVMRYIAQIPEFRVKEPQGAFYLFPEVSALLGKRYGDKTIRTSGDLSLYLLEQAHVATVDGAAFGADGYIRFSYATSEANLEEAMRRIIRAVRSLK